MIVPLIPTEDTYCVVDLCEGLPSHIHGPTKVKVKYSIQENHDYFTLDLSLQATIDFECQRCREVSTTAYTNQTILALCDTEEAAEKLMKDYEPVVITEKIIDLAALILEEMHLSAPLKHEVQDCVFAAHLADQIEIY